MAGDDRYGAVSEQLTGFNPRPRMAGDGELSSPWSDLAVSIRARAWRAIFMRISPSSSRIVVSIRARAWRAIKKVNIVLGARTGFNPRPRMAGDTMVCDWTQYPNQFQSAPAHGGRFEGCNERPEVVEFQSAPAHGGRSLPSSPSFGSRSCFNPRPRMAGDQILARFGGRV